eukprot:m.1105759 g.1105759  ORF g.1105759 m.1105759 type:complete len:151 (-) comp24340_c0_seq13:5744-6196(-)
MLHCYVQLKDILNTGSLQDVAYDQCCSLLTPKKVKRTQSFACVVCTFRLSGRFNGISTQQVALCTPDGIVPSTFPTHRGINLPSRLTTAAFGGNLRDRVSGRFCDVFSGSLSHNINVAFHCWMRIAAAYRDDDDASAWLGLVVLICLPRS